MNQQEITIDYMLRTDIEKHILTVQFNNNFLFSTYIKNSKWEFKLIKFTNGIVDEINEENDTDSTYNMIGDLVISKKPIWEKQSESIVKKIKTNILLKCELINSIEDIDFAYDLIKKFIKVYISSISKEDLNYFIVENKYSMTHVTEGELNNKRIEYKNNKFSIDIPKGHFIRECMDWTANLTDGYSEYSLYSALWLLSALDNDTMLLNLKQEEVKLNIWSMMLGNSSTSRKSTTMNKFRKVYEDVTDINISDTDYSLEGLIDELSVKPITHQMRDEASGIISKMHKRYNDGIFANECSFYDGRGITKTLKSTDMKTGELNSIVVENPYLTKLYATTPDKISDTMTFTDFSNGWGFRFMFCNPRYTKPRMPFALNDYANDNARENIINRSKKIYQHNLGIKNVDKDLKINEFKISQEVLTYFDNVCVEWENKSMQKEDDTIESLNARGNILLIKIAMLYELGKEEISTTITKESIYFAKKIVEYSIKCANEILDLIEEDVRNNYIEKIVSILRRNGGVSTHSELLKKTKIKSKDFIECIDTLIESKSIELIEIKGKKGGSYSLIK